MGVLIPSTHQRELATQVAALLNDHNRLYYKVTVHRVLHGKVDYLLDLFGDIVVGCIGLRYVKRSDTVEICHLCVHPIGRGRGLAKKLIQRAIELSPRDRMWCHIREENVASIRAFESQGFKVQREKFRHDKSWMLTLRLERNNVRSNTAGS
jgi:ribosomal protein S18 acetylase RimI-like enzyme